MPFIVLDHVSKTYQSNGATTCVLSDVTQHVQEGEFVCLMGPSGSGKSTLLAILGAMSHPSQGRLLIDGIDVYDLADEARADFRREYLGFVFQQHHLMPYLTAVENVMLPLAVLRSPGGYKRQRAMEALYRVGLADKAARLPGQLSGGEQGRLAIARALVNDPPLLLADEPTGALDTHTGSQIMEVLLELGRQGRTVFIVTHNPESAALADRTIHIRDGRIQPPGAAGPGSADSRPSARLIGAPLS
ncbi:MAG: ABC transporter ATP-binding protein [Phycisphaeraceae bacterium]